MNKSGFTLIEILLVVVMIAVITVSSVVVFNNTSEISKAEELKSSYVEIQRAARMYIDLNDYWVNSFNANKKINIKLGELQSTNYVANNLKDPKTGDELDSTLIVKLYITQINDKDGYISSCILRATGSKLICVADNEGNLIDGNKEDGAGCCCLSGKYLSVGECCVGSSC